jgi:hypothetical protein
MKLGDRSVQKELNVAVEKAGLILVLMLLTSCQRPPAEPSVPYQIIDEGRTKSTKSKCLICVVPTSGVDCQNDGRAAQLRWQLPRAAGKQTIRVLIERPDGSVLELANGSSAGEATLRQPVLPGDRIVVVGAENKQELMFARVHVPLGCDLRSDQDGGTTSIGPG